MVTANHIRRLADSHVYLRLLDEISANGRPLPVPVRIRLSEPRSLRAAALGLGLLRMTELVYLCSEDCLDLLDHLGHEQQADGSFGSVAATAAAVRGLYALSKLPGLAPEPAARLSLALMHAISSISWVQDDAGLIGDEIDSLLCLGLLGGCPPFVAAVRFGDLFEAVGSAAGDPRNACVLDLAA